MLRVDTGQISDRPRSHNEQDARLFLVLPPTDGTPVAGEELELLRCSHDEYAGSGHWSFGRGDRLRGLRGELGKKLASGDADRAGQLQVGRHTGTDGQSDLFTLTEQLVAARDVEKASSRDIGSIRGVKSSKISFSCRLTSP